MSVFYNQFWKKQGIRELGDFSYKWPVISKLIPTDKRLVILDYGCGHGKILSEMNRINPLAKYIGMDVSKEAMELAKKHHRDVTFCQVHDGGRLPIKNKSVDFIFAGDVIEHVFYTEKLLSEFSRVLKKKGTVLISTPFHGVIKNILIAVVGFEKVFDPKGPHIRFFTMHSLEKMLWELKFVTTNKGYYGRFFPIWRGMYILSKKEI